MEFWYKVAGTAAFIGYEMADAYHAYRMICALEGEDKNLAPAEKYALARSFWPIGILSGAMRNLMLEDFGRTRNVPHNATKPLDAKNV